MQKDKKDYRKLESVMTKKVFTTTKEKSVLEAAKVMAKKRYSCVVVVEKDKPIGMVTERDFIKRVIVKQKDPAELIIKDIMTSPIKTVCSDSELLPATEFMRKKGIRRVPVTDSKGKLVGIATETDIMNGIIRLVKHLDWKLVSMKISAQEYMERLKDHRFL